MSRPFLWFGNPTTESVREVMRVGELGVILTPAQGLYEGLGGVEKIVDNGSFGQGYPGDVEYLGFLASIPDKEMVRFAVAPDVVADPVATLARSRPFLPVIRALGFQVALAAQNGLTPAGVPWADVDVIFLGGVPECLPCGWVRPAREFRWEHCPLCGRWLTEWKISAAAAQLIAEAVKRGKEGHMGRVNGAGRAELAQEIGCSSADGTTLARGPDANLPLVRGWMAAARNRAAHEQGELFRRETA